MAHAGRLLPADHMSCICCLLLVAEPTATAPVLFSSLEDAMSAIRALPLASSASTQGKADGPRNARRVRADLHAAFVTDLSRRRVQRNCREGMEWHVDAANAIYNEIVSEYKSELAEATLTAEAAQAAAALETASAAASSSTSAFAPMETARLKREKRAAEQRLDELDSEHKRRRAELEADLRMAEAELATLKSANSFRAPRSSSGRQRRWSLTQSSADGSSAILMGIHVRFARRRDSTVVLCAILSCSLSALLL